MKTLLAIFAGIFVFLIVAAVISITQAMIGFHPAKLGSLLGTAYLWLCGIGSLAAARWAFRKIKPPAVQTKRGPLSGSGK